MLSGGEVLGSLKRMAQLVLAMVKEDPKVCCVKANSTEYAGLECTAARLF